MTLLRFVKGFLRKICDELKTQSIISIFLFRLTRFSTLLQGRRYHIIDGKSLFAVNNVKVNEWLFQLIS